MQCPPKSESYVGVLVHIRFLTKPFFSTILPFISPNIGTPNGTGPFIINAFLTSVTV